MTRHKVRRLPVIDLQRLVGMVSVTDVAKQLPGPPIGEIVDVPSSP